jgi:hypothetical protein
MELRANVPVCKALNKIREVRMCWSKLLNRQGQLGVEAHRSL